MEMPLWNEAVEFAAEIYIFCEQGKLKTDFRMKDQLRAAVDRSEFLRYFSNKSMQLGKKIGGFIQYLKGLLNNPLIRNSSIR
jgi:hypothetical protein